MFDEELPLELWVREEKARLDRFAAWYRQQREANPNEDWPLRQQPSGWDENYQTFHDPEAPQAQS